MGGPHWSSPYWGFRAELSILNVMAQLILHIQFLATLVRFGPTCGGGMSLARKSYPFR